MWAKLDDALLTHPKIDLAGPRIGPNGPAIAIGFYAIALMWTNKYLTDGFLPMATIDSFRYVTKPRAVAEALAFAGLLEKVDGGFRIHDFDEWNPSAKEIKQRRKDDRIRKRNARAGHNGRA